MAFELFLILNTLMVTLLAHASSFKVFMPYVRDIFLMFLTISLLRIISEIVLDALELHDGYFVSPRFLFQSSGLISMSMTFCR